MRRNPLLLVTALAAVLAASACGTSTPSTPSTTTHPGGSTANSVSSSRSSSPVPASPATSGAQPASSSRSVAAARSSALPRPAHVVVVVMENHAYSQIIGNRSAPYLNALAAHAASFTHSYAVAHPSEPNYLALFSGSTQGLTDDSCPHHYRTGNLGTQLRAAGKSFRGYSEGLPRAGYRGCNYGNYARRHVPWTNFPALPASVNQPFSAFPKNYAKLPTVSFVIPNVQHDMHNGTIAQGDRWLRRNLSAYARWAKTHNSLLVVTWDEDDDSHGNRVLTVIAGAHVKAGRYSEHVTHYRLLRTLQALERLPGLARSRAVQPISGVWRG